jgi:hypothetical protein
MVSAGNWLKALAFAFPLFLCVNLFGYVVDDEVPDVTGRVARISYLSGEVQVRRSGAQDWEKAVLNLPVVEGDEIVTSVDARLEIQFDVKTFVRMEQNSALRITTYKDEGIALSVPEGTVSIRVTDFDKDRSYLEIDIPNSTVSVQRAGLYRIDAGNKNSTEARVRVTDGGEARVYSDTSGFTLRNGRAATIFLAGTNLGDWDTTDAAKFSDVFDTWTLDRDTIVAKRIKDSFYDKYYDRDIYGAEDLSDYGEWVYTRKYGYVWRPFRNATGLYADWSPYRYGHWRWVPPYGWTWINDEPWGWATYHYGRWVWDSGYWYWTPYGYYRYRRSWWSPALVVINIFNNNVCWYPLSYRQRYHNYSRNYGGGNWGGNRNNNGGRGNGPGPTASPTPNPAILQAQIREERRKSMHTPPLSDVPPGGVVTVALEEFGKGRGATRRPSLDVARTVLSKNPDDNQGPAILLPPIETVRPKISKEIRAELPTIVAMERPVRTGAAERKTDQPLDEELKRTRILGNRTPIVTQPPVTSPGSVPSQPIETRRIGAVDRPPMKPREETPATQSPPFNPTPQNEERRLEQPRRSEPRYEAPKTEAPRNDRPGRIEAPRYEPPPQRSEPPPRREERKVEPPPTREQPRQEAPRRIEPPPAQKSEPRPEKPSQPLEKPGGKKDG